MFEWLHANTGALGDIGLALIVLALGIAAVTGALALVIWGIHHIVCWLANLREGK